MRMYFPLYLRHQVVLLQGRTQGEVQHGGHQHRDHSIDQRGDGAHFCPDRGNFLRNAQNVHLIEVAHHGIGDDIKRHAGNTGQDRSHGQRNLAVLLGLADVEYFVGNQAGNEADAQLQQEGFGREVT